MSVTESKNIDTKLRTAALSQSVETRKAAAEEAINALKLATELINLFVDVCDEDQLSEITGVRYWLEVYGV